MEQTSIVSKQTKLVNEESRIARECRGRRLALLGSVFITNDSKVHFYVASESNKDIFYFVEYKQNANYCTCWDYYSNRSENCKHILAVGYALRLNLVQKIDHKLPICQKVTENFSGASKPKSVAEQYKDLSISTLNELEKADIEAENYNKAQRVQRWQDDTYGF